LIDKLTFNVYFEHVHPRVPKLEHQRRQLADLSTHPTSTAAIAVGTAFGWALDGHLVPVVPKQHRNAVGTTPSPPVERVSGGE